MNVQFKKGILELCVLSLLRQRDHYGYELVQKISIQIEVSEGTIYPLLRRLGNDAHLTTYLQESVKGPPRKYYTISETGKNYLDIMVKEWLQFIEGVNELLKKGDNHE